MKKILVVETPAGAGKDAIPAMLVSHKYKLIHADASRIREITLREKPDLIIWDTVPFFSDALEAVRSLRNYPSTRHFPILLITGSPGMPGVGNFPADLHISKPFEKNELFEKIELLLNTKSKTVEKGGARLMHTIKKNTFEPVVQDAQTNLYSKRQPIYTENARADYFYYLRRGRVRAYRHDDEGKEVIVDLFKKGDLFGFPALFNRSRYVESTETLDNCELAVIPKTKFEKWLNDEPEVNARICSLMVEKIHNLEIRLALIAYGSLRKKVAGALLMVLHKYPGNIRMSRSNLAQIAGTATESLIRTLSQFRVEKLIEIQRCIIIVLDEEGLRRVAD